jgi:hypothetical protein
VSFDNFDIKHNLLNITNMEKSLLVHSITPDDLKQIIKEVFKEEFAEFTKQLVTEKPDELLNSEETCKLLKITLTTLWRWTKSGKVICYGIAGRRYFKKNELLERLVVLKQKWG